MWILLMFLFLADNSVSSSSSCGTNKNILDDKIVGGRDAKDGEFPWQASLQAWSWMGFFYHKCGASLLTREWLVTAAHCIQINTVESYRIMIGNYNLSAVTEDQLFTIKMIVIKQGFDPQTFENDIALIQLFHPVPEHISSVCLTDVAPTANSTGVVTGWGATEEGGNASPYLQAVDVVIIPRNVCLSYYSELTDSMTCAGYEEGERDACQGDSGGPLIQWRKETAYLIGIVSWGDGCAEPNHPGVYTDVIQFIPWIKHYIF